MSDFTFLSGEAVTKTKQIIENIRTTPNYYKLVLGKRQFVLKYLSVQPELFSSPATKIIAPYMIHLNKKEAITKVNNKQVFIFDAKKLSF